MEYKFISKSIEDTLELAENLESEKFPGMIICLNGELGSGKTVFTKGIANALGIEETITSRKPLNKRKLGQLLDELQYGDILIAAEISRLGRSLLEVMRILETCLNKNCQVWTLKERLFYKSVCLNIKTV